MILLEREGAKASSVKPLIVDPLIGIRYPWDDPPNGEDRRYLREKIKAHDEVKALAVQRKAHYLSTRSLNLEWVPTKLAQALAGDYVTMEDVIETDAGEIAQTRCASRSQRDS